MELEIVTLSKPGGRARNEDACGVWSNQRTCFCVLADGAGGHGGGDVASKLVVKHALAWLRATPSCSAAALEAALRSANEAVVAAQKEEQRLQDMRATAAVLGVDTLAAKAVWGHLGDSRIYCFRNGRVVVQTRDHSVVQSMVDAGYIGARELSSAQERSKLLCAMGDADHFEPEIEPGSFSIYQGDAFLLCTDGFWEYVRNDEMETGLAAAASAGDWLRGMETLIVKNGRPEQDNYSAIALWCREPDEATRFLPGF